MGVYHGYYTFKKAEGRIRITVSTSRGGINIYDWGRPHIYLSKFDSKYDK